jgi:hypothetical protein
MNPKPTRPCERGQAIDGSKARERLPLSPGDKASHRQPLWFPEDIVEPDPWTLASFSDLLPHSEA